MTKLLLEVLPSFSFPLFLPFPLLPPSLFALPLLRPPPSSPPSSNSLPPSLSPSLPLFSAVVGEKEMTNTTVNVRTRDNVVHGERGVEELLTRLAQLRESRANDDSGKF